MGFGSGLFGALGGLVGLLGGPAASAAGASIGASLGGGVDASNARRDADKAAREALAEARRRAALDRRGNIVSPELVQLPSSMGLGLSDPGAAQVGIDPTEIRMGAIDELRRRFGSQQA